MAGNPGGSIWQAGRPILAPPKMRTAALRSIAQLTAWRASLLLNGGRLTFMGTYQSAKSVLMCTCSAYFVPISLRRSAGGKSKRQVGLAVLDLRDLGLDREAERLHDAVDVAVGLRVGRPLLEVRVALEHELRGSGRTS